MSEPSEAVWPGASPVSVRPLRADDATALAAFFLGLRNDPSAAHFHPHPFTTEAAERIAQRRGIRDDVYYGAFSDGDLVGYGMLRGWDEGYAIPSFGVAVRSEHRGRGVGRRLLRYAISVARDRGSPSIMLKVHPSNAGAKHLYESEGFAFEPKPLEDGQLRGLLTL